MRKRQFLLILSALCLLPLTPQVYAMDAVQGNRLIFFGDSLTDTGNFPEPANVNNPQRLNFNLYVPISNPLSVQDSGLNEAFLQASLGPIQLQGTINGSMRRLYSVNWPLYYAYMVNQQPVVSWYTAITNNQSSSQNVNFAWASAFAGSPSTQDLSNNACLRNGGALFSNSCSTDMILAGRNAYLANTKKNPAFDKETKYQYNDLVIPTLGKQVSLYLENSDISLKPDSTFFIYIGNNDIGYFLKQNIPRIVIQSPEVFQKTINKTMPTISNYVLHAVQRIEAAYKQKASNASYHINILTLTHLSNLAEGYAYTHPSVFGKPTWIPIISSRIEKAINNSVDAYNAELHSTFDHDEHVTVLDAGKHLDKLASNTDYQSAVNQGAACVNESAYTTASAEKTNNCHYIDQSKQVTYFSWNNAHLTSPANKAFADYIASQIW